MSPLKRVLMRPIEETACRSAMVLVIATLLLKAIPGWAQTPTDSQACKDPITGEALPPIRVESSPHCGTGQRCITFTRVPCKGIWGQPVAGRIELPPGEKFSDYQVCLYILVAGGWWTKPTFSLPCVDVTNDGTWEAPFTTGGSDQQATQILAVLTPKGYLPPRRAGQPSLPKELEDRQFARALADRGQRRIEFSGLMWTVKDVYWDPGPNQFSSSSQNVWVDAQGLHLKITRPQPGAPWLSSEVVSESTFGYGRYIWTVSGPVDKLNENVVLGLFTLDLDAPQAAYREFDVEFSRWGNPASPTNTQYAVQPYTRPGSLHRFSAQLGDERVSTHILDWRHDGIRFQSIRGDFSEATDAGLILQEWSYPPADVRPLAPVPEPGKSNVRMNLWFFGRKSPSDGKEVEVVIRRFTYIP